MSFLDFLKYEPKVFSRKAGFFAGALAGLVMGLLGVVFFVVLLVIGPFLFNVMGSPMPKEVLGYSVGIGFVLVFVLVFMSFFKAIIDGFFGVIFVLICNKIPSKKLFTKYFLYSAIILLVLQLIVLTVSFFMLKQSVETIGIVNIVLAIVSIIFSAAMSAVLFTVFFRKFNKKYELATMQTVEPKPVSGVLYSSFKRRLVAFVIDAFVQTILIMVLATIVVVIVYSIESAGAEKAFWAWYLVVVISIILFYPVVLVGAFQKTIGMHLMRIKVSREDGSRVGFLRAFVREIAFRLLGAFTFGLAWAWIIWDSKKQGWHDKIAQTFVIKEK